MKNFLLGLLAGAFLGAGLLLAVGYAKMQGDYEESPAPPSPPTDSDAGAARPDPGPVPEGEDGEPDGVAEPGGAEAAPPPVPEEPAFDLATRTLVNRAGRGKIADWERNLALLGARREEVIPILENWIRRWQEISRSGAGITTAYLAYAALAGADAIPLLEEHLYDDPGNWGACRDALTRIDDPRAATALHRFQESRRPKVLGVTPDRLWWGSESSRQLVREWADGPPRSHPELAWKARQQMFRAGTEPEKERVWREADPLQRRVLLSAGMFMQWQDPWPERYRTTVLSALESDDSWIRVSALGRIVDAMEFFGEKVLRIAEEVLDRDLAVLDPQAEETDMLRRRLQSLKSSFNSIRWEEDRRRRVREILKPR